jgi:hypothetical protein
MKKFCFIVLLACTIAGRLLANGIPDVSHLPGPDVQIQLPRELIGVFEFVFEDPYMRYFFGEIEIYENNKYFWRGGESARDWGHVIEDGDDYYLLPLGSRSYSIMSGYYIQEKTKIVFAGDGFSFTPVRGMENMTFVTVRKDENNPRPEWQPPEGARRQ